MANVYMGTDVEDFIFGEATFEEACKKEEVEKEAKTEVEEAVEKEEAELMEAVEAEMAAIGVQECVDEPEVACYRIALENEQNYNAIMNAYMMKEFSVLESTGTEMVYEAADIKRFFSYIKETIASWWRKIQGVIKKVIEEIAKFTDLDMKFVKKYKGQHMMTPEKVKTFKGFDFSKAKPGADYANIAGVVKLAVDPGIKNIGKLRDDASNEFVEKFKEDFKATKNKMRGIACSVNSVNEEDFDKQLKIAYFGSEEKVFVPLKSFNSLLEELEFAKYAKASAKRAHKSAQESVKALLKEVKSAESAMGKSKGGSKIAKCLTDSINAALNIMSRTMSMETRAIMANLRQNRAMATFYVANQPKESKAKNESAVDDLGIVLI